MSPRKGLDLSAILRTATELIDEQGFTELSLGSLAKRLDIRTPSLYNHIEGLNGLKQKLAIHGLKKLHENMVQAAIGRSGDEAVRGLSKVYLQFARVHPGLYEATLRAPEPDEKDLHHAQDAVVQIVVQVLQSYRLEDEMALHTVRGFRSILHGFASLEQIGGFGLPLDLDKTFRILIDTFIDGIHTSINKAEG